MKKYISQFALVLVAASFTLLTALTPMPAQADIGADIKGGVSAVVAVQKAIEGGANVVDTALAAAAADPLSVPAIAAVIAEEKPDMAKDAAVALAKAYPAQASQISKAIAEVAPEIAGAIAAAIISEVCTQEFLRGGDISKAALADMCTQLAGVAGTEPLAIEAFEEPGDALGSDLVSQLTQEPPVTDNEPASNK